MTGKIDLVTPEGVVEGWCWNETQPSQRVTVIIAVDGREAARVVACDFREDLKGAGIGDGSHAFRGVVPIDLLEANRSHRVTIVDAANGVTVGEAYEFRAPRLVAFDDRLGALEARAALLEGRVQELPGSGVSDVAAAELFAIVGAFFERLSRDIAEGKPVKPERQLGASIQALLKSHPRLIFSPSQYPAISIVIDGSHPVSQVYACLAALKRATLRVNARITVLDTGTYDDLVLLPSVARGVRYIRNDADLVSEWIQAEREETTPFVMFLGADSILQPDFLDAIMEWFDSHPRTGAIGGCASTSDGSQVHGGLCLFEDRLEDCAQSGHCDTRVDLTTFHPVHALSRQAAVVRRAAFQAVGGLDPMFGDDLGSALIDLCFRLRESNWTVGIEPRATVQRPVRPAQSWAPAALATPSSAGDLLYKRWLNPLNSSHPPLATGVALIIAQPDEVRDEIDAARSLREAGYLVFYSIGDSPINDHEIGILKNIGASVRPQLEDKKLPTPTLIFTAINNETPAVKLAKTRKAKFVTGLTDLKRLLRSSFMASPAS